MGKRMNNKTKARVLRWIGVALGTILISLTGATGANADYVEGTNYSGARWYSRSICVEDRTPSSHYRVRVAVQDWSVNTTLSVWHKYGAYKCKDWRQQIIVTARNEGRYAVCLPGDKPTAWVGCVQNRKVHWGQTPAGSWTYLWDGPLIIRLNTYYSYHTSADWDHIITHELGHAFGLGHVTWSCNSVMSVKSGCTWREQTTYYDRKWINVIYAQ